MIHSFIKGGHCPPFLIIYSVLECQYFVLYLQSKRDLECLNHIKFVKCLRKNKI